eukprot:CAMPEP_0194133596 /NCGR_PEP_ID=MMETSP0152-20130528/3700_1 /TAXON_ID=1049557 /ORGANISM="Thalassiothrix antarctica, Strain L6-D1" /LENGTH=175 /DNA_ID=CAMNT_0038828927 /DNA_START=179 /DNA_END=706 /DNA_ORIENTATION=+
MKADWEKIAEEWKDHERGLIGQVDCTVETALCEEFEVESYPTLYYGDPTAFQSYAGERDYESMAEFANEYLGKDLCSVSNTDSCSDEKKAAILDYESKSTDDLKVILEKVQKQAEENEKALDEAVADIQERYKTLVENFNAEIDRIESESHYSILKEVIEKRDDTVEDPPQGDEL